MAPTNKSRGFQRQPDLDLAKYLPVLEDVPDDSTLGRLQSALETLLSERSHPMVVALQKQLERLKTAESVIEHEMAARKSRADGKPPSGGGDVGHSQSPLKRKHQELGSPISSPNSPISDKYGHSASKNEQEEYQMDQEDVKDEISEDPDDPSIKGDPMGNSLRSNDLSDGKSEETGLEMKGGQQDTQPNPADQQENEEDKPAGNNKFIPNPKSEFVNTQSLPTHTIGIFNEDREDMDDEEYKRRLGVVSYPKEDLSTLTAGPVPMDDFTRSKPSNQIQFQTYATFLEPYFRPFTEDDIQFLQQPTVGVGLEASNLRTGQKLSPYAFPPLGPHYHQQWAQQDAEINGVDLSESARKSHGIETENLKKLYQVYGSINEANDQDLETSVINAHAANGSAAASSSQAPSLGSAPGSASSTASSSSASASQPAHTLPSAASSSSNPISLGPFTERLIAAIMPEVYDTAPASSQPGSSTAEDTPPPVEKSIALIPPANNVTVPIDDFAHLEERIKGEFRYVGVFDVGLLRRFEQSKYDYKLAVPANRDEFSGDSALVDVDWVNGAEDDEISRELRVLQRKLKGVSRRNSIHKQRLLPVLHQQMAWQEYQTILQDLDKQVDQAYMKRSKAPKVTQPKFKKRKGSSDSPADSPEPFAHGLDEKFPDQKPAIKALIEKRERWISKIGPLFKPAYEMMREYEHPKFENIDDDVQDEDEEEE